MLTPDENADFAMYSERHDYQQWQCLGGRSQGNGLYLPHPVQRHHISAVRLQFGSYTFVL